MTGKTRSTLREVVINGRFLGRKSITGVERYGFGILKVINEMVARQAPAVSGLRFVVAVPSQVTERQFEHLDYRQGPGDGYVWEQFVLPCLASGAPIFNFCNLAPVIAPGYVCIHDAHIHVMPQNYTTAYRTAHKLIQPLIAARAKRVVTVSEHSKSRLVEFGVARAENITVIPPAHDHVYDFDPARSRLDRATLPEKFVLLVGSDSPNKNMELIVGLAPRLAERGIHVLLVGTGGAGVYSAVQKANIPLDNVRRLGRVSDDDLALLYQNALCFLFPSIEEGFGIPPLEAFALASAVIVSNTSSMPAVCGNAALYASPHDADSWLEQIAKLDDNAELKEALVESGRERAKLFSFNESARMWLHMLREKEHPN